MRVLHFGRFHRSDFGGIERHVESLIESLRPRVEMDNVVANERWRSEVERRDGYTVYRVPSLGLAASMSLAPGFPLFVRRLWRSRGYDIAHLHFPDPLSHLATLALPRSAKVVVTWHSDIIRQRAALALYRPFLRRFLRRVDAVVAATAAHFAPGTQIAELGEPAKFHVIPYGIDVERFAATPAVLEQARTIRTRFDGKPLVFAVGRHVYYKGFEFLIRAMARVDATLVLGGTGPLIGAHRDLARSLGLESKVEFPGRIPDEELPAYYRAADVVCMPSVERAEAFGLVQLEAMAAERPLVNCALGNGVNLVAPDGVAALTVPPREAAALAQALNRLLADAVLRAELGARGRARAQHMFSLQAMADAHWRLYQELVA
jgi:glycosyltransferase involved in cell wall biosynthesis